MARQSGGRQLSSFLEELKAKHVSASDLSTTARQVHVQRPPRDLRRVIDLVAKYVAQMGEQFEEALRQSLRDQRRELRDELEFLKADPDSAEVQYYRWRVFSFAQGDTRHRWRAEPFQMCTKGLVWHPPPPPKRQTGGGGSASSSSSRSRSRLSQGYRRAEDDFCAKWSLDRPARLLLRDLPPELREQAMMKFNPYTEVKHADYSKVFAAWTRRFRNSAKEAGELEGGESHMQRESGGRRTMGAERLRRRDARELERLLKGLTPRVGDVGRAMVWCLDTAECAMDISRILLDSLTEDGLDPTARSLRLCVVSDILHNAATIYKQGAIVYKREFEHALPGVFEKFHALFQGETQAPLVRRTLQSWVERAIFTAKYVKGLEASMLRGVVSAEEYFRPGVHLPETLHVKLAEWQTQHFSQLEKICKAQGLNWDVQLSEKAQAMSGRFPEELRKKWLLDRLLTYELYAQETRPASRAPPAPAPRREVRPDPELDGEPWDSDDEDFANSTFEEPASKLRPLLPGLPREEAAADRPSRPPLLPSARPFLD